MLRKLRNLPGITFRSIPGNHGLGVVVRRGKHTLTKTMNNCFTLRLDQIPAQKEAGRISKLMLFGRRNAQRESFERHAEKAFSAVFGTALRLTRSKEEAEDLAQEAVVRAYEAYDRFDGGNFKAWILRIVTNLYINKYRSRQRGPQISSIEEDSVMEPMSAESTIPDRVLFDNVMGSEIEQALTRIPDDFRVAVILSDVEGMSYQEIADITDVPIGTVRSRIARGRALLRRLLETFALREGYIREGEQA